LPVFEQDVTHVDDETAGRIGGGQDSVELLEQAGAKLLLLALGSLDLGLRSTRTASSLAVISLSDLRLASAASASALRWASAASAAGHDSF